jgi:hypothetical protein
MAAYCPKSGLTAKMWEFADSGCISGIGEFDLKLEDALGYKKRGTDGLFDFKKEEF